MGCRMQLNLIWLRVRVSGSQRHTPAHPSPPPPAPGGQCPDVTNTHEVKCESVTSLYSLIRLLTSISICPSFCALKCPFLSSRGLSMKPALLAIYSRGSRKYNKKIIAATLRQKLHHSRLNCARKRIGHFRVAVNLIMKTRLSAKQLVLSA